MIAKHFPERIDEIREQERSAQWKRGFSSFFTSKTVPERFRSVDILTKEGTTMKVASIDDVVLWSQTAYGGSQYDFDLEDDAGLACDSGTGMCE